MSFLKNTVSLLALFSVIPVAYAATARPSAPANDARVGVVNSNTGSVRRMPTMAAYLGGGSSITIGGTIGGSTGGSTGGTTGGSTGGSSLLTDTECVDAYTACIKGGDACGGNFEECTNRVLFHAKMPQCLSTLAQCSTGGIYDLFGTSATTALSNVATTNTYGEVTDYTYPTDGSILGQYITAAAISNKYDTASCIRRYTSCLKKESVCGSDFELCTTNTEFKKQAVACDSTLARCQSEGKKELFGNASATSATIPSASSRIGELIAAGAGLAAANAVSTCYKVVDQCIMGACTANPYKCYENAAMDTVDIVEAINKGSILSAVTADPTNIITKSKVASYVKSACLDTVGANKYCYATFLGDGLLPSASQLRDEDNREEVYDLAYSTRMNSVMRSKIEDLVNKFDTKTKEKCVETIRACAMRTCGSGSGAACYSQVFGGKDKSVNNKITREEIRTGCMSVVNSDPNCKYAAQNPNETGTYVYTYSDADAFDTLFPVYEADMLNDPLGVVASLNASLANNYSDAAIAQMKKQCQTVATSCVKSMCGKDYVNCYRNRTDIYSSLTDSGNAAFDKSMNKVGGVLDYTIVLGLCVDTVKNAKVCTEHLAIEANKMKIAHKSEGGSWGTDSVRSDWIDAGGTSKMTETLDQIAAVDENGNELCRNSAGEQGLCNTVDESGDAYDEPVMISYITYVESQAANTLFKDLIYDLEIEAQAKYNAKLTKQQNMCISSNDGGIMGVKDLGSTFLWAKLKSNKVPNNYSTVGLKSNQFVASNDLYGSFCRVRVTLQSDDVHVQDALSKGAEWSTAYFAAGDAFTCGSWIPKDKLEDIAAAAGKDARDDKEATQPKIKGWVTALGALGLGGGGAALGASIWDGEAFEKFQGLDARATSGKNKISGEKCDKYYNAYETAVANDLTRGSISSYVNNLKQLVKKNDKDDVYKAQIDSVETALRNYNTAYSATDNIRPDRVSYTQTSVPCSEAEKEQACKIAAEEEIRTNVLCSGQTIETVKNLSSIHNCRIKVEQACNAAKEVCVEVLARKGYRTNGGVSAAEAQTNADTAYNNAKTALDGAMSNLRDACEDLADDDDKDGKALSRGAAAGIGAAAGAIAGGALAYHITDSIMDAALDKAEQEAIKEFMDTVGSKIKCYVGGDEVGEYGEVISTSME